MLPFFSFFKVTSLKLQSYLQLLDPKLDIDFYTDTHDPKEVFSWNKLAYYGTKLLSHMEESCPFACI